MLVASLLWMDDQWLLGFFPEKHKKPVCVRVSFLEIGFVTRFVCNTMKQNQPNKKGSHKRGCLFYSCIKTYFFMNLKPSMALSFPSGVTLMI